MVEPHPDDSRLTQPMDRWWLARHLGMLTSNATASSIVQSIKLRSGFPLMGAS